MSVNEWSEIDSNDSSYVNSLYLNLSSLSRIDSFKRFQLIENHIETTANPIIHIQHIEILIQQYLQTPDQSLQPVPCPSTPSLCCPPPSSIPSLINMNPDFT